MNHQGQSSGLTPASQATRRTPTQTSNHEVGIMRPSSLDQLIRRASSDGGIVRPRALAVLRLSNNAVSPGVVKDAISIPL